MDLGIADSRAIFLIYLFKDILTNSTVGIDQTESELSE